MKEYPKDKEYRRFKLSEQLTRKLREHVRAEGLGEGRSLVRDPRA